VVRVLEEAVVVDPHDEDGAEAQEKGDGGWPEMQQRVNELAAGVGIVVGDEGDVDFEDQQGDGNGKDTIAEGFDASGLPVHGGGIVATGDEI
jgi:hypothetical protein